MICKQIFLFVIFNCYLQLNAADTTKVTLKSIITGFYRSGNESFYFDEGRKTYYLMREQPILKDVFVPLCYDTIAVGHFDYMAKNVVKLKNNINFNQVLFNLVQENGKSSDSLYFTINFLDSDTIFNRRFSYQLNYGCKSIKTNVNRFSFARYFDNCNSEILSLQLQDLSPLYCNVGQKCFQRIYFKIFDLQRVLTNRNVITINLINFNKCYLERMDLENELVLVVNKDCIFWNGKKYEKDR